MHRTLQGEADAGQQRQARAGPPAVVKSGETKGGGPELKKPKQRKQVREALDKGKKVLAIVTVRAKDPAGNVATAKRTIRLVK